MQCLPFDLPICSTPMTPDLLTSHLAICRAKSMPSIVRAPGPTHPFIKWILDAGADGIIVPQVRTVEEVKGIVDVCRCEL